MNWFTACDCKATDEPTGRPGSLRKVRRTRTPSILAALTVFLCVGSRPFAHAETPATVTVTAKLAEIPTKFPPDDLYDYAYVMRYEVVGGPMDKQSILVAHYKPRQPRSKISDAMKSHVAGKVRSFKVGDTHKLQITSDLKKIWKGALVDEFASTDRKSTRYWALSADPS